MADDAHVDPIDPTLLRRIRTVLKDSPATLAQFDLLVGLQPMPCSDAKPHRSHPWFEDGLSFTCDGIPSPGELDAVTMWPDLGKPPFPRQGTDGRLTYSLRTAVKSFGPQIVLWCHSCDRWISGSDGYSLETVQQQIAQHEEQDETHAEAVANA